MKIKDIGKPRTRECYFYHIIPLFKLNNICFKESILISIARTARIKRLEDCYQVTVRRMEKMETAIDALKENVFELAHEIQIERAEFQSIKDHAHFNSNNFS